MISGRTSELFQCHLGAFDCLPHGDLYLRDVASAKRREQFDVTRDDR